MTQIRSILLTGCSSGIGAYCARALKAEGWRVLATVRTNADLAALAAEGIEAFQLDYRDATSIATLFETVMAATGGTLDAVFNNGAYSQPGAVEDLPIEALREQFEANVFGWHDLTRRIVPVMRAQGHGRIVQCSSILGLVPMPYRGAYNASKHAIEALSLTLRMELKGSGIHVSLIEPGPIESKIAINALRYVEKYIDIENSVHRAAYEKQLARLRQGGVKSKNKLGPDAVHAVLTHALNSPKPRPHYAVTRPAKLGVAMKRILPAGFFYDMLARQEP
jgi:NAD(P)-dependent dehydrogenase (short-subunit alcohol dehydrogenase family)